MHRTQVFTRGVKVEECLGQLFDIRSCAEHLHDWDCGLQSIPVDQQEEFGSLRAYQAEMLAGYTFANLLLNPKLLEHFRHETSIDEFWRLSDFDRNVLWGERIDIDIAGERFCFAAEQ